MNNFEPPKDFEQSIRQQQLSVAFREMYLLVRALHMQTDPASRENKILLAFFEEIMKTEWSDEEKVNTLVKTCQDIMGVVIGGKKVKENNKETNLVKIGKENKSPVKNQSQTKASQLSQKRLFAAMGRRQP